ncbi:MAG: hypothetical protein FOGNACKC_00806 [Anaerolineae bacterium]|nr:hypothetical protein [Anaerolineae bacterium]
MYLMVKAIDFDPDDIRIGAVLVNLDDGHMRDCLNAAERVTAEYGNEIVTALDFADEKATWLDLSHMTNGILAGGSVSAAMVPELSPEMEPMVAETTVSVRHSMLRYIAKTRQFQWKAELRDGTLLVTDSLTEADLDTLKPLWTPGKVTCVECRSANVVGPDREMLFDCGDCGIWFKVELLSGEEPNV